MTIDRARLLVTVAASLGVACGAAPRTEPATTSQSAQIVDGQASCGVGSAEEQTSAPAPASPPVSR